MNSRQPIEPSSTQTTVTRTTVTRPPYTQMQNSPQPSPRNGVRFKIAAYERVSRPTEVTGSHTFDTQLPAIERKLDLMYGAGKYDIVNFCDNGVSGGYGATPRAMQRRTRAQFAAMCKRIQAGEFDAVAAYDLSRLYRSGGVHHHFIEEVLLPSDTDLIIVNMDINIRTPAGKMMGAVLTSVNANYLDSCEERSSAAAQTRRDLGYAVGPPPYGWRYSARAHEGARRDFEPDPDTKPVVLYIRERYMAGVNIVNIAKALNDQGTPAPAIKKGKRPPHNAGTRQPKAGRPLVEGHPLAEGRPLVSVPVGLWNHGAVLSVLNQPLHAGLMYSQSQKRGELVRGRHFEARFYEPADYEAILQKQGKRRRTLRTNAAKANNRHWLTGLLFCRRCGQSLKIMLGALDKRTGDYPYRAYRCATGSSQGKRTCPDVSVSAHGVETMLGQELERLCADVDFRETLHEDAQALIRREQNGAGHQLPRLLSEREQLTEHRRIMLDRFHRGTIDEAEFLYGKQSFAQQQIDLDRQIAALQALAEGQSDLTQKLAEFERAYDTIGQHWSHLPGEERRGLLDQLLEGIAVDCDGRDVTLDLDYSFGGQRRLQLTAQSIARLNMKTRPTGVAALTPRELTLLHYYRQGLRTKAIAEAMGITEGCVARSSTEIRKKLNFKARGLHDLGEAVQMAAERLEKLADSLLGPNTVHPPHHRSLAGRGIASPLLSSKNKEVLIRLSQGLTPTEIARELGITPAAVNTRRKRILDALGVHNIPQAAAKAKELGLM